MRATDIIKQLNKLVKEHGNLDVRLWCDHGQSMMQVDEVCISYIDEDVYMAEDIHEDDLVNHPEAIKVINISAY